MNRNTVEHKASVRQIPPGNKAAVGSFTRLERRMNAERSLSVAPTEADVVKFLTGRSALHADIEHALLVATNADGREVVCCAALINRRYQQFHKEAVGFIGYFAASNEAGKGAIEMLEAAERWLAERGVTRVVAGYNGHLLAGFAVRTAEFESSPVFPLPWHPPLYTDVLETAGYHPTYPWWSYRIDFSSDVYREVSARALRNANCRIRPVNKRRWDADIEIAMHLYNESFRDEWEYHPFTIEEVREFFKPLKAHLRPAAAPAGRSGRRAGRLLLRSSGLVAARARAEGKVERLRAASVRTSPAEVSGRRAVRDRRSRAPPRQAHRANARLRALQAVRGSRSRGSRVSHGERGQPRFAHARHVPRWGRTDPLPQLRQDAHMNDGMRISVAEQAIPWENANVNEQPAEQRSFSVPVGAVTFVLTDIAGSTRLWEADREAMAQATMRHYEIVDQAVTRHGGVRPLEQGEGDSTVAAFSRASDAVRSVLDMQRALRDEPRPGGAQIRVRIGIHTGEAQLRDDGNYFGAAVARCARLRSIGHGGQTLLSRTTRDLVGDDLPDGATLVDLGEHRLRDLARPEHVFQLCHPELASEFPPLVSLDLHANNLPMQLTSFIGREAEMREIGALLLDARLLTLTGAGGCGKTRLALQVGADVLDRFPDGIWLVDLAPVADPGLLGSAIAAALSVREVPGQEIVDTLTRQLSGRAALVILDNCEHLIAACASVAEALLVACPSMKILATSREPLGVAGETAWRVPSLSLPAERTAGVETLTQCEAVRLFIDRALRVRPNFAVRNDNAPALADICRRLDGIALAIEFAAARVRVLTLDQIADGLNDRFSLLTSGARTALPRQRTLEASVDWSFSLLDEDERTLLCRLSVFAGGFTLDGAEAVGAGEGLEPMRVLDVLSQLVDKSLVQVEERDAAVRYRLLETVRQYGRQRLADSGEAAAVRGRHLDFFVALAERAEPELESAGLREWVGILEAEHDDLRAAVEWALRSNTTDQALRISGALFLFFVFAHAAEWRERTLVALEREGSSDRPRARALVTVAGLSAFLLELDTIRRCCEEALALGRSLGDDRIVGRALVWSAWEAGVSDPPAARRRFEEALAASESSGDACFVCQALVNLGFVDVAAMNLAGARLHLERSLAIAHRTGDMLNAREALTWLAWTATYAGEFGEAQTLFGEARRIIDELGDVWFAVSLDVIEGFNAFQRGDLDRAQHLLQRAVQGGRDNANLPGIAAALVFLGVAESAMGDVGPAGEHLEEGLALVREMEFRRQVLDGLVGLATVSAAADDPEAAQRHLDEAFSIAREFDLSLLLGDAYLVRAGLRLRAGDAERADDDAHEALRTFSAAGAKPGMVRSLEMLGEVAAAAESYEEAARLLAAVDALRATIGFARYPIAEAAYNDARATAQTELGTEAFDAAAAEGATLALDDLVAYAQRARGERKRPSSGWASLTPTELEVVRLAAEGLTNPAIGARMFISPGTVKVHLSHIFAKLGVSTRAELASEATRRGLRDAGAR